MTTAITVIATVPVGSYPWGWRSAPTAALTSVVTSCSVVASIGFDRVRGPGFSRETLYRRYQSHRPRVMIGRLPRLASRVGLASWSGSAADTNHSC
jgi:hypothetical protein